MKQNLTGKILFLTSVMATSTLAFAEFHPWSYHCSTDDGIHKVKLSYSQTSEFESSLMHHSDAYYGEESTETWDSVTHYEKKLAQMKFLGPFASNLFSFSVIRFDVQKDGYYAHTIYSDGRVVKHYKHEPAVFTGGFRKTAAYGYDVSILNENNSADQIQVFARIFAGIPFETSEIAKFIMTCKKQFN